MKIDASEEFHDVCAVPPPCYTTPEPQEHHHVPGSSMKQFVVVVGAPVKQKQYLSRISTPPGQYPSSSRRLFCDQEEKEED